MLKLYLVFVAGFWSGVAVGYWGISHEPNLGKRYAITAQDCKSFDQKHTGWVMRMEYKGGINRGGATSYQLYECE